MRIYILNGSNEAACIQASERLSQFGAVFPVPACPSLPAPEQYHADMRFCKIADGVLVCSPADSGSDFSRSLQSAGVHVIPGLTETGGAYPNTIAYNVLRAGSISFHNTKYTDPRLKELLESGGRTLFHIRQGYAGCSSIAVPVHNGTLILSSDMGILSAVSKINIPGTHGVPCLFAEYFTDTDTIVLDGYDHGFIGGCCGFDADLGLLVCGKINGQLRALSERYGFNIISLYDGPLTDIGGILTVM